MAGTEASRFDKALARQGLELDARDKPAALRVFASLERACAMLKKAVSDDDKPR